MAVRSQEQLAVLLKLVDENYVSLFRKNVNIRQKVWAAIADKLNVLPGTMKDVDGWKRTYTTWRLQAGTNYVQQFDKIISEVPDDDYFNIIISDDEESVPSDNEDIKDGKVQTPCERQKVRLHELVRRHKEILASDADDKALKSAIWINITQELNAMPNALKLTPVDWQKCVDFEQYRPRRGRKSLRNTEVVFIEQESTSVFDMKEGEDINNISFEVLDNEILDQQDHMDEMSESLDYETVADVVDEQTEDHPNTSNAFKNAKDEQHVGEDYIEESLDEHLNTMTHDFQNGEDSIQYVESSPNAKSFKFSIRMVNAVESMSRDLKDIKKTLEKTAASMSAVASALKEKNMQGEQTNALLKRNAQLLKVLVEYKIGKRAKY